MVKVVFDVTVVGSVVVVVEGGLVAAAVGLAVVGLVEDGISTAVVVSGSSTAVVVVVVVVTNVVVSVLKTNLGSMILGVDFLLAFTMIPPETGTAPTELRVEDEEEVNEVVVVVVELGLTWVVDNVVVVVVIDIVVVGVVDVEDFCEARRVSVLFLGRRGGVMRMEGLRVPSS